MAYTKEVKQTNEEYFDTVAEALDDQAGRRDLLVDRRGPGRPPGAKNLSRPGFRELTYEVMNSLEMGGLQGYVEWAMSHKSEFYGRLCPKLFGGEITLLMKNNPDETKRYVLNVPIKALDFVSEEKIEDKTDDPLPFLNPMNQS